MKNVYMKKSLALCKVNEFLYENDSFFESDIEVINEIDDETREVQLCNYIEIPSLNIILNICFNEYYTYNNDDEDYSFESDISNTYIIVRDDTTDEILYSEESNDIEDIVLNYLYDSGEIDDVEAYSKTKEFKSIPCNIVRG